MRPSISLENHRDQVREVLQRFRMANPRIFGSAARGEDTEQSDLDILVDAPNGTSLYDLAGVELAGRVAGDRDAHGRVVSPAEGLDDLVRFFDEIADQ